MRRGLDELERRGYEVTRLTPGEGGAVTPEQLRAALRPDTVLVSLMLVNNETGAVTDIASMAQDAEEVEPQARCCTRTPCRASSRCPSRPRRWARI